MDCSRVTIRVKKDAGAGVPKAFSAIVFGAGRTMIILKMMGEKSFETSAKAAAHLTRQEIPGEIISIARWEKKGNFSARINFIFLKTLIFKRKIGILNSCAFILKYHGKHKLNFAFIYRFNFILMYCSIEV
jgi:hypothetical protein